MAKIFKNFQLQDFFCDHIHGLHLCDNFGVFNINIEDFIGKNSEKITKNDPPFSYIKVKTSKMGPEKSARVGVVGILVIKWAGSVGFGRLLAHIEDLDEI